MPTLLTFHHSHHYGGRSASGIVVPVMLTAASKAVRLLAKVDTGADHCIFERVYGEQLGLDLDSGQPAVFRTANGEFRALGHEVTITCFDRQFDSFVFFPASLEIGRNVLGRQG